MDKMSLIAILTVSVPEHFLDIIIGLLITGQKKYLRSTKENIYKLITGTLLMALLICSFRAVMPNFLFFFPVVVIIISFTFVIIYRFNIYHSLLTAIIIFGILTTINMVYLPSILIELEKNFFELQQNNWTRFILSLPERIMQVLLTVLLWNTSNILINIKKCKPAIKLASLCTIIFTLAQIIFSYIAIEYYNSIPKSLIFVIAFLCVLCSIAKYLVLKLSINITQAVSIKVLEQQENINDMSFKVLYKLMENKQFDKASDLCKKEIESKNVS